MVTLKDVAKYAGVSIATVSCCLSGTKNVSPQTKDRILNAVEALKYIPNAAARNLKTTHSNKIGVVFPHIDDSFFVEIFKGISAYLQQENYLVNIVFSNNNEKQEREKIDELIHENVAGLLIITCQPENQSYFSSRLDDYRIPTVFIHSKPTNSMHNVVAVNNYDTTKYFATQLLQHNYTDIALIMGPRRFSHEDECFRGVRDAYSDQNKPLPSHFPNVTNITKEDAFRATMNLCKNRIPHAIICTSTLIAKGVKEALDLQGLQIPQDIVMCTLGEFCWNNSEKLPGVLYSNREADALGREASQLLLREITQGATGQKTVRSFPDNAIHKECSIPMRHNVKSQPSPKGILRILVTETPSITAIEMMSRCYTVTSGVQIQFDYINIRDLLRYIEDGTLGQDSTYDICMFDSPWTPYVQQFHGLLDLTDFVAQPTFDQNHIFKQNMDNCKFHSRYYGIPISGGAQIMFYRKDLFESPALIQEFRKQYNMTLRPPKTWEEYNTVAEFFTKSYTPNSPTTFGTILSAEQNEFVAPQIMLRIWSYGGRLWNNRLEPTINTPQIEKAYRSILSMMPYIETSPFTVSLDQMVSDFCQGRIAMMVAYTEYTQKIRDSLNHKIIGAVGYESVPGNIQSTGGWNFGINTASKQVSLAKDYLAWLCQPNISQYSTILGSQTTVIQPYHNPEIIGLYPWMELIKNQKGPNYSRLNPEKPKQQKICSNNSVESILCNGLRYILEEKITVKDALQRMQQEMETLFHTF